MQSTAMPGRSSTSSASKRPPRAKPPKPQADLHLLEHEELRIGSSFRGPNLDDDSI
jgi:hypothetical protein